MKVLYGCTTDKGNFRNKNQDAVICDYGVLGNRKIIIAAVCDGIGSMPNSEKAAAIMTEGISNWLSGLTSTYPGDISEISIVEDLELTLQELNEVVYTFKLEEVIGCTMSVLLVIDNHYYIFHIGDSRIYKFSEDNAIILTEDQIVRQNVNGKIKSALVNYIGKRPKAEIYKIDGVISPNELFVVCSDGLYKRLQKQDVIPKFKSLRANEDVTDFCSELISIMIERGETDNISCAMVVFKKKSLFTR